MCAGNQQEVSNLRQHLNKVEAIFSFSFFIYSLYICITALIQYKQ